MRGSPEQRFWAKVIKRGPDECWDWVGSKWEKGYGQFYLNGKVTLAHRFSFKLTASIPEGMTIDHLCLNKACVNPAHMEIVSFGENARRYSLAQTSCKRGHAWTEQNTRIDTKGSRRCRECDRLRWHKRQHKIGAT